MKSKLTARRFKSNLNNIKGMANAIPFVFWCPFKIDPQGKFFRNLSEFFGRWIDLPLGDNGCCTRPLSSGGVTPCLQTRSMYKTIYTLCNSFSNVQKYSLRSSGISCTSIVGLFSSPKSYWYKRQSRSSTIINVYPFEVLKAPSLLSL